MIVRAVSRLVSPAVSFLAAGKRGSPTFDKIAERDITPLLS